MNQTIQQLAQRYHAHKDLPYFEQSLAIYSSLAGDMKLHYAYAITASLFACLLKERVIGYFLPNNKMIFAIPRGGFEVQPMSNCLTESELFYEKDVRYWAPTVKDAIEIFRNGKDLAENVPVNINDTRIPSTGTWHEFDVPDEVISAAQNLLTERHTITEELLPVLDTAYMTITREYWRW
jgi:hypothetical protein